MISFLFFISFLFKPLNEKHILTNNQTTMWHVTNTPCFFARIYKIVHNDTKEFFSESNVSFHDMQYCNFKNKKEYLFKILLITLLSKEKSGIQTFGCNNSLVILWQQTVRPMYVEISFIVSQIKTYTWNYNNGGLY